MINCLLFIKKERNKMSKKFLKKINKLFESINIYGVDFHLLYKKEEIYHTNLGFLFSIFSIIIVIGVSLIYFLQLFNNTSFSLTTNMVQIGGEASIDFSNVPLLLSFSDLNGTTKNLEPTLVNLKIERQDTFPVDINGEHTLQTTITNIEIEECKNIEFNTKLNEQGYNINNYMCVKSNQNLKISGRFGDSAVGFSFLKISLNKCQNDSNIICRSEDEILKYFENTYLSLLYLSFSVDHYNKYNPIIEIVRSDGFSLSFDNLRRYFYYFSPSVYESDQGIFYSKRKLYKFFEFELIYPDIIDKKVNVDYTKNNPSLTEIFITFYCRETHYVRKYVTIQEVLGNIGGFLDIILKIFQYLSVYLSQKAFICDLMNRIVSDEFVKNGNFKKNKIIKKFTYESNLACKFSFGKNLDKSSKINILNSLNPPKQIYINNYTGINKKFNLSFFQEMQKRQRSKFYVFEYIFPIWILKCSRTYELLFLFFENMKKLLSIEVIIPIIDYNIKNKISESELG